MIQVCNRNNVLLKELPYVCVKGYWNLELRFSSLFRESHENFVNCLIIVVKDLYINITYQIYSYCMIL